MDSALTTIGLPIALGIIMFGLGLSLTVEDFRGVRRAPKAVAIALACQLLLLPSACFGLVLLLDLPPIFGVGMMLLAASPGGPTANIYSHLFRGDVALNITLTAVNSVLAIVTLPLITNLALGYFGMTDVVDLQFGKMVEVFAIVLVPVAIGMIVRAKAPDLAARLDKPFRIASALVLLLLIVGIAVGERATIVQYAGAVGAVTALYCLANLILGYAVPRLFGIGQRKAVASSFEIGIHNATLAIYVAIEVLGSVQMSIPSAMYGLIMFVIAAAWGMVLTRWIVPRSSGSVGAGASGSGGAGESGARASD